LSSKTMLARPGAIEITGRLRLLLQGNQTILLALSLIGYNAPSCRASQFIARHDNHKGLFRR
jgi:hypothetical protein